MGRSKGYSHSEETLKKMSVSAMGNTHGLGYKHTKKARQKISEAHKGKLKSEEHKLKLRKLKTEKHRQNMSASQQGIPYEDWNGYISFEPYCSLFNFNKKEEIRNRDNRVCILCDKSEILNGARLSVHHIDGDKMQGCNKKWHLVSLCKSCNSKLDTIEKEFLIVSNLNLIRGKIK